MNTKTKTKITILVMVIIVISFVHYVIPTTPHGLHMTHIAFRKLYFLPLVMAAVWFGLRGAILAAVTVSILFTIHAFVDWPKNYMEQANQLGELASFWAVGIVSGWLFDRQRSLLVEIARANEETLLALVSALDMREWNTKLHSQRVKRYALLIADVLGMDERTKKVIGIGALMHDVGKISIPDTILLKPSGLTEEEWKVMKRHPEAGYQMLKQFGSLHEAAEIVYAHHEHFDGSGYPLGLKGEHIPIGARIFAVADVYDALTSERPYHEPLNHDDAVKALKEQSGHQFDPAVIEAFLAIDSTVLM